MGDGWRLDRFDVLAESVAARWVAAARSRWGAERVRWLVAGSVGQLAADAAVAGLPWDGGLPGRGPVVPPD